MVEDGYIYTWIPTTAAAAGMIPKDKDEEKSDTFIHYEYHTM